MNFAVFFTNADINNLYMLISVFVPHAFEDYFQKLGNFIVNVKMIYY